MDFNIFLSLSFLFIPLLLFAYQLFFGHILKHDTWWVSLFGIGLNLAVALSFLYQSFFNS